MRVSKKEIGQIEGIETADIQEEAIVIDERGDLLLLVRHSKEVARRYRVTTSVLRTHSSYFDALLDGTKFSEGRAVDARLADLRKLYPDIAAAPYKELPSVTISEVDVSPSSLSSGLSGSAFEFFLRILHGHPEWPNNRRKASAGQSTFLAVLTHFAEMFASVPHLSLYIKAQMETGQFPRDIRPSVELSEEKCRRKLYVGLVLGLPQWVRLYSAALIIRGSHRWCEDEESCEKADCDDFPWHTLAGGVEEELEYRRTCVLDTISSLQTHFITLYISGGPQCKLGYDSSPQCDDFQLGSMIRFFTRKGMLKVQSTFAGTAGEGKAFTGDIGELLKSLKECPNYQIDANHRHCGLRARIITRLDSIDPRSQVGICLSCWRDARSLESWVENTDESCWQYGPNNRIRSPPTGARSGCTSAAENLRVKMMYTATEKDWTPSIT
ncbi:MAG: hypothetical protein Q9228_007175 [Teloschistes exilis]